MRRRRLGAHTAELLRRLGGALPGASSWQDRPTVEELARARTPYAATRPPVPGPGLSALCREPATDLTGQPEAWAVFARSAH
ncbi:hypothetical protein [Streptomyces sp. NPDC048551]|uniref:hypothetical protein n=1 Tax=Streptomyces sp. NPDC048551 TaxID=3155758 RepID=UPI003438BB7B